MRPSLRQLDAFLAVAEAGRFSKAARRLGSTQPAVSQAVKDLETNLGLRLFDRTTRRVALTGAGVAYRAAVIGGLESLDRAAEAARDAAALRQGRVRLAAPPFLAGTVLPGALAAFCKDHPGLTVDLADLSTPAILARLREGGADLALGTFPAAEGDLIRRPVLTDAMMAFALPGLLPQHARWADLLDHPVIVMAGVSGLRLPTELGFEAAGLALAPAQEVQGIATALALAAAGFGVAILPGYARSAGAGLVAHRLSEPLITRPLALVHPEGRSLAPAAVALADHLVQALRKLSPETDAAERLAP